MTQHSFTIEHGATGDVLGRADTLADAGRIILNDVGSPAWSIRERDGVWTLFLDGKPTVVCAVSGNADDAERKILEAVALDPVYGEYHVA